MYKLSISNAALFCNSDNGLFAKGLLHSLYRLKKAGYAFNLNNKGLEDFYVKLLEQEMVVISKTDREFDKSIEIDFNSESKKLLINGHEKASDWPTLVDSIFFPDRIARMSRHTKETKIDLNINIDGTGKSKINTGLKFFDHMLDQIAKHGLMDIELNCDGDLEVDEHHTIEDVGIALGECLLEAIGDKKGINRYSFVLAMDESQATVALDLSGRPYLVYKADFNREYVGDMPTEMFEHFFYSLAMHLKATLHIEVKGQNEHHKIESVFKALAKVLRDAIERSERTLGLLPSSKGTL